MKMRESSCSRRPHGWTRHELLVTRLDQSIVLHLSWMKHRATVLNIGLLA